MANTILKATLGVAILIVLFSILPFQIGLPTEIVEFFKNGAIQNLVNIVYYFFPIDFMITCLIFLYSAKYLGVFMNIISWIYHKVVG